MASYVAQGDSWIEVIVRGRLYDQTIMLVRHYKQLGATPVDYNDAVATLEDIINQYNTDATLPLGAWAALATTDMKLDWVQAQFIQPVRYRYEIDVATPGTGAAAPPTMPQNTAIGFINRSIHTGRKARGTTHIAGMPVSYTDSGYLTVAAQTALLPLCDAMKSPIVLTIPTIQIDPILFDRTFPLDPEVISDVFTEDNIRVMRRRTVRLGI